MTTSLANFHDVQALVIDTWHDRRVLRYTLHDLNLHKVTELDSASGQRKEPFDLYAIDLILANVSILDPSAIKFISDIRWRRIPCNPFTVVVLTSNTPAESVIRPSINSGADAILLKPFSPQKLKDHVMHLVERRYPFVVNTDYVGPERRGAAASRTASQARFDVPNTLRNKVMRLGVHGMTAAIEKAWGEIGRELTGRLAAQILFFIRLLHVPPQSHTITAVRQELSAFPAMAKLLLDHLIDPGQRSIGVSLVEWLAQYPKLIGEASRVQSRDVAEKLIVGLISLLDPDGVPERILADIDDDVAGFLRRLEPPAAAEAS